MTDTTLTPSTGTHAAPPLAAPAPAPAAPAALASTLGDPFALGLAGFGIPGLVLATVMSGIIDPLSTPAVLSLALAMGFLVELVAGILHLVRGETFPGMVFVAFAGFWLSYALLIQFYLPQTVAAGADPAPIVGMFLLVWGVFSTYMLLAGLKTNLTTIAIFAMLSVVFYLAALGSFTGSTGLSEASGYLLVVNASLALYASAAIIVNGTWDRQVLPVP